MKQLKTSSLGPLLGLAVLAALFFAPSGALGLLAAAAAWLLRPRTTVSSASSRPASERI